MKINLLGKTITPAEGETSVRTYHCTYYRSRLLGLKANGYLAVTNKRVIFQALGKSSAGRSVIQSEVPIVDVSGINSYKGTYFSFVHLFGALLVAWLVTSLLPALLMIIAESFRMNYDVFRGMIWILTILAAGSSFFVPNKMIWRTVLASASAGTLTALVGRSFIGGFLGGFLGGGRGGGWEILIVMGLAIYTLVCISFYARRPTFSLSVASKGGSSTPINISGATGFGIFDIAAGKALTAAPAKEAEIMLRELGAVVLDIQTLGDLGINKWRQS